MSLQPYVLSGIRKNRADCPAPYGLNVGTLAVERMFIMMGTMRRPDFDDVGDIAE
jgi:hypothetical protein